MIILLVALVTGCAPATFGELRKKPGGGEASFQATQNYASVYRTILTNARKCYQGGAITAQLIVQGDLYPDTKSGEITVALHGGLGVDTYLGIDIKAIDDGNTTVKMYSALSSWSGSMKTIQAWVEGKSTACKV